MDLEFNFSHLECHLYFYLLNIANQSGWSKAVSVTNKRLCAGVCTENKYLIKARQKLNDAGLIVYIKGTTRKAGIYYMNPDSFPLNDAKATNQATNKCQKKDDYLPQHIGKETKVATNQATNQATNVATNQRGNASSTDEHRARKIRVDKIRKDNRSIDRENVYKYFRENFEDPKQIISRLKNKNALGDNFEDFIFFLIFEKKAGDFIKLAKKPVGYIMKLSRAEWPYYQQWKGERDKKEVGDAAMSISYE
jgi:hypothetical protein